MYNMRVDPSELIAMLEDVDKYVISITEARMVKLIGFDLHDNVVQLASGFLYTPSASNIITCKDVRYYTPSGEQELEVHRFIAQYASDGVQEEVHVLTPPQPLCDLMVLRGSRCATTNLIASNSSSGDVAYVAGFPPDSSHVCFSKGMIGSVTPISMTVTADADTGWSGGPVVNRRGRLVGVMHQGFSAISAARLHNFLCINNCVGLSD
jgi:hypothetical protein